MNHPPRTIVVSRHPGALAWLRARGHDVTRAVAHLDEVSLQPGDTVIGTLPLYMAADVIAHGARYLHISMRLPAAARGRELGVEEMDACQAQLLEFHVERKHA